MTKKERTLALLKMFKGNRDEFSMLKGILCMDHYVREMVTEPCSGDWEIYKSQRAEANKESKKVALFDLNLIAERLDEMNGYLSEPDTYECIDCGTSIESDNDGTCPECGWNEYKGYREIIA